MTTERTSPHPKTKLRIGDTVLSSFQLLRLLYETPSTSVYFAKQHNSNLRAALTIFHTPPSTSSHQEYRTLNRIQHPNIAPIYAYGITPDNFPVLATQYTPGRSLHQLVTPHTPLQEHHTLCLLQQLLSALAVLHANNCTILNLSPHDIVLHNQHSPPLFTLLSFLPSLQTPDTKHDIFLLGSLFAWAFTGTHIPFTPNPSESLKANLFKHPTHHIPHDLVRVVGFMLHPTPALRPDAQSLLDVINSMIPTPPSPITGPNPPHTPTSSVHPYASLLSSFQALPPFERTDIAHAFLAHAPSWLSALETAANAHAFEQALTIATHLHAQYDNIRATPITNLTAQLPNAIQNAQWGEVTHLIQTIRAVYPSLQRTLQPFTSNT